MNQGLREAVLLLQRRSEAHEKVERELRVREAHFQSRCEDLERCLSEMVSQLEEEIQSRKAAEEMLRKVMKDAEKKRRIVKALPHGVPLQHSLRMRLRTPSMAFSLVSSCSI